MTLRRLKAYQKAYIADFEAKQKMQNEINNINAWATGAYIQEAIASIFGKHKYPKTPNSLTPQTAVDPKIALNRFDAWATVYNETKAKETRANNGG